MKLFAFLTIVLLSLQLEASGQKAKVSEENLKSASEEELLSKRLELGAKAKTRLVLGSILTLGGAVVTYRGVSSTLGLSRSQPANDPFITSAAGLLVCGGGLALIISSGKLRKKGRIIHQELNKRHSVALSAGLTGIRISF